MLNDFISEIARKNRAGKGWSKTGVRLGSAAGIAYRISGFIRYGLAIFQR